MLRALSVFTTRLMRCLRKFERQLNKREIKRRIELTRRQFIQKTAWWTASSLVLPRCWAASVEAGIEVLLNEPIGTISPNVYGHFTEHIGGVIYDGIWVGEDSKIPNDQGIRADLVK